MDVNTDGAVRSYHPQDPRGHTRALNNIVNATSGAWTTQGVRLTCDRTQAECFRRYIAVFETARDNGWSTAGARVETYHMIPWRFDPALGRRTPCLNSQGYFVSQTAFLFDPARDVCDQARYLDAAKFNAIVLPNNAVWRSQRWKADQGDLAVTRDRATGRIAFAIVGDTGPARDIGEGTLALVASLGGKTLTGSETRLTTRTMGRADVDYLIFNGRELRRTYPSAFSQEDVDRMGREAFDAWGGEARLSACARAA